MKVIQVVGGSSSGKTTFIRSLVAELRGLGRVAAVKHLGGHPYMLEPGRDTTLYFEGGVEASVGVDSEKSVYSVRSDSLDDVLRTLSERGIDYAVLEGWKSRPFPCIAIGDLETPHCVLRNPAPREVTAALGEFPDYHSIGELAREAGADQVSGDILIAFRIRGIRPSGEAIIKMRGEVAAMPGVAGAAIAWSEDPGSPGKGFLLGAVRSPDALLAIAAMSEAIEQASRWRTKPDDRR